MIYYMQIGGVFMWPIFIMLVFSVAVIIEKIFYFTFIEIDCTKYFKLNLAALIQEGNHDSVKNFCIKYKNSLSKAVLKILKNSKSTNHVSLKNDYIIEEAIQSQLEKLEKRNWVLSLSANICPQIGLLGTIVGMIIAFGALSDSANAPLVAVGISQALYTTAFGLIVAIPSLGALSIINKKIDTILYDLNKITGLFARCDNKEKCEIC